MIIFESMNKLLGLNFRKLTDSGINQSHNHLNCNSMSKY